MRAAFALACCASFFLSLPLRAEEAAARVRAIYHQAASGVLVDPSWLRRPSAARWADVELADGRLVLVRLPSTMDAKPGDLVAVQLATPKSVEAAEPMRVSRITGIKARATQLAAPARRLRSSSPGLSGTRSPPECSRAPAPHCDAESARSAR